MTLLRTESFVPLTVAPVPEGRREFHVAVLPREGQPKPFHLLETPAAAAPAAGKKNCEPRVSVQRDGDRVTSIRVQCSCGQVMDLACIYNEPPKDA